MIMRSEMYALQRISLQGIIVDPETVRSALYVPD
jgi:hypothetical protein